jgi:sigma-B regulation protein RsbU (phosphoserine phosphatase)
MTDASSGFDDLAPCGYVRTGADGIIDAANDAFLALGGYDRAEIIGRWFPDLLTAGGRLYHESHLAPILLTTGAVGGVALEIAAADGRRVPILINAALDRDADGRPWRVRIAVFDATERRAYEAELLAARADAEASEAHARLLVRTLQQTLIPPAVPAMEGLDLAAAYRPAGDGGVVGGDFYDVFETAADDWVLVVGDVTGKGVEAAMVTALARNTIRAVAVRTADPRVILATLNEVLRSDDAARYCSVVAVRLTRHGDGWRMAVCHGGHPLCLLVRTAEPVSEIGRPGTILGAFPTAELDVAQVALGPGDAFVLYTDGVTEGRAPTGEFFGEPRTWATLERRRGSANGLVYGLLDEVVGFQGGDASDDIVVLAVRVPEPVR